MIAGDYAAQRARLALERQMGAAASLESARLEKELERYRAIPYILSRDMEVMRAVSSQDAAIRSRLSARLSEISQRANVGGIYVRGFLGEDAPPPSMEGPDCGRVIAATYVDTPNTSSRTNTYACNRLGTGVTEGFAVATVNRPPGMYFAQPIYVEGVRAGMVGTKAEFDDLEAQWAKDDLVIFVSDRNGVILMSSLPEWKFRTLKALPPSVQAEILRSRRFGPDPLEVLPVDWRADSDQLLTISLPGSEPDKFVLSQAAIPATGWTVNILTPGSEPIHEAKYSVFLIVLFSGILAFNLVRAIRHRRMRLATEAARQAAIRIELEKRVEERTAELKAASAQLQSEMDKRRKVARKVNSLREELVQANKLATLGQITAGVAHEINQPLTAIRAYADSAVLLLQRNEAPEAEKNLIYIANMTERISLITQELRTFSRRSAGTLTAVDLTAAIDGALLLSNHGLALQDIEVVRQGVAGKLWVVADQVRLEQVLVNLIQNAMEAMEGFSHRRLTLTVEEAVGDVVVRIQDSGPGLSEAVIHDLFMPFVTTKPKGLGLGLVISKEIITEFGGDLTASNNENGAQFTLNLRRYVEST